MLFCGADIWLNFAQPTLVEWISRQCQALRKCIIKPPNQQYDLITEEGQKITDSTEHKNYIANYFEDLNQAREGSAKFEDWTNHIKKMVISIEITMENTNE